MWEQDTPIPRINGDLVARSIGSTVSNVGTGESVMGNSAVLHSSVSVGSVT